MYKIMVLIFIAVVTIGCTGTFSQSKISINRIQWSGYSDAGPIETDASGKLTPEGYTKQWLQNATKYSLTTWWNEFKNFDAQEASTYLDFVSANNAGSRLEQQHRESSSMSYAIAVAIKTRAYSSEVSGISEQLALSRAKKLTVSLAYRHVSNSNKNSTWGVPKPPSEGGWQTALWAAHAGYAGWLLWEDLSSTERGLIINMVEYEANRMNDYKVPYYKNRLGEVAYPGDSKIEENAWNSYILSLATSMMPNHNNYAVWKNKQIELLLSSFATPEDLNKSEIYHGKPLADWLNGSNLNNDGTVINHNIIHPDYMAASIEFNPANMHFLAGQPTPKAAFFNQDLILKAFVELNFGAGTKPYPDIDITVRSPGGSIFVKGENNECAMGPPNTTGNVYYPMGSDWGEYRRPNLAMFVANAYVFGFDKSLKDQSKNGEYWLGCFAQNVVDMQIRHHDGHTYANNNENNYSGREGQSAVYAARAWMALWIKSQGDVNIENSGYHI